MYDPVGIKLLLHTEVLSHIIFVCMYSTKGPTNRKKVKSLSLFVESFCLIYLEFLTFSLLNFNIWMVGIVMVIYI